MTDFSALGRFDTPSRKWWVNYNGGISLIAGVHEFIFRGDDSLTGAVVRLTGAGLNASWGMKKAGKVRKGGSGQKSRHDKDLEDILESSEDAINAKDSVSDHKNLQNNSAPWCNISHATLLTAKRPFSLYELDRAWGGIQGIISADGLLIGGALLRISASMSVVSAYEKADPNTLFEGWTVYNIDDGSIGVSIGFIQGKWSVERYDDLFANRCPIKGGPGLERFYSTNVDLIDLPDR